jgi:hypothetical protein
MTSDELENKIATIESKLRNLYREYDVRTEFWRFEEHFREARKLYLERNAPYPKISGLYGDSDQERIDRIDEIFEERTENHLKFLRERSYDMTIFEKRLNGWWKK